MVMVQTQNTKRARHAKALEKTTVPFAMMCGIIRANAATVKAEGIFSKYTSYVK
jgi:hypothetical protein